MNYYLNNPNRVTEIINEIKSNDKYFFKVFNFLKNNDYEEALDFIKNKFKISVIESRSILNNIEKTYTISQRDSLLEFIYTNNPEYVI